MVDFSQKRQCFGVFSIGVSGVEETVRYIEEQEEHHRKKGFREEFEVVVIFNF